MFKSNTLVIKGEQQNYLLASSTANCQAHKLLNRALPLNQSPSFLLPLFLHPIPLFSPSCSLTYSYSQYLLHFHPLPSQPKPSCSISNPSQPSRLEYLLCTQPRVHHDQLANKLIGLLGNSTLPHPSHWLVVATHNLLLQSVPPFPLCSCLR